MMTTIRSAPLALTLGEPAGIGPDILIKAAAQTIQAPLVCIGSADLLKARAKALNIPLHIVEPDSPKAFGFRNTVAVQHMATAAPVVAGQLNVDNSHYVIDTLKTATLGCLENAYSGIVTGPLHKGIICQSGVAFSGHTEYFAELTNTQSVVMMLATGDFRVALATTHIALKDVAQAITFKGLYQVVTTLHNGLKNQFNIDAPHIIACGLNPHAGEDGHLGREEIDVLNPCFKKLRDEGVDIVGPFSADTLFTPNNVAAADAVLAMYHDQGLPVLKYVGFGQAVNITLGLPFVRTSVDHGTALSLAGSGQASETSLILAIRQAHKLVTHCTEAPL